MNNKLFYNENWNSLIDMKMFGPASQWLRFLFSKLINSHINKSDVKNILDMGCGEGTNTALLAKTFPYADITGIDFSETAIECACFKYGTALLSGCFVK